MKRLLLIPALVTLVGCVKPPIQGRADPYVPAQVHLDSDQLRRDTAFGTPIVTRNEAGLLVVTVPVRSAIDQYLHVDYHVTFFDANGKDIEHYGPFSKTLDANTPSRVTVNSTSPLATDFQIDFRYAR